VYDPEDTSYLNRAYGSELASDQATSRYEMAGVGGAAALARSKSGSENGMGMTRSTSGKTSGVSGYSGSTAAYGNGYGAAEMDAPYEMKGQQPDYNQQYQSPPNQQFMPRDHGASEQHWPMGPPPAHQAAELDAYANKMKRSNTGGSGWQVGRGG
jgi:hypothetical protein